MSTATQVESFCESCGTRYAFEPRRSPKRHLVKVGRLVGILADEPEVDDSALVASKDPFHGAFHFCLECRRFTCPTCWDSSAGFCRSCASVLGGDGAAEAEYTLDPDTQALLLAAHADLARLGSGESWLDLAPPPEARPEPVAVSPEFGDAPEDDLTHIIEAAAVARLAREAQAAREEAEAAEREQARLDEERLQQAEAERVAAEQAEAQRVAWEEYEQQRLQYEADLAAWEAAEAERTLAEQAEARRLAAVEAERVAAEQAEAQRAAAAADERRASEAHAILAAAVLAHAAHDDAGRADAGRAAAAQAGASQAEAARLAAERAEAERQALEAQQRAEAERMAAEAAEAQRLAAAAEAARLAAQPVEDPVWESLAVALGPDVAAEETPAPPAPERPQVPLVPQVPPPPPPGGPWQVGGPQGGMPGWAPPPPAGYRPPPPGWHGGPAHGGGVAGNGHNGNGQLRTGIRPCARCDLALSANARFCRRCGLPQG